ncbi:hypothetical protein FRB95_002412 [Tulasnella sp. JGI-2019a]|nr:hypothetical protein FRB93_007680 [Tulasnella sp. JGI-2019a]KAG9021302.1 hypothetical protein FRB95_002412 [Tulasnella sp. JGI-2019a]
MAQLLNGAHPQLEIPGREDSSFQRRRRGSSRSSSFSHPFNYPSRAVSDDNLRETTRSVTMPIPEGHQHPLSSTSSFQNFGLAPTARRGSYYTRASGAPFPGQKAGLNIMSDDEREKKSFHPATWGTETDGSSGRDRSVSHRRHDRADKVRAMVDNLQENCSKQEARIKGLEWQLTNELARSRQLSDGISDTNKRLESRHAMLAEILTHSFPRMTQKLETATKHFDNVSVRIPQVMDGMNSAEKRYDRSRIEAIVLEQHLQWRTTPWYTKAKMYLRGDQTLNWHDTSSHRWQTVASTVAWFSLAILSATTSLVVGYLLYLRYWIP